MKRAFKITLLTVGLLVLVVVCYVGYLYMIAGQFRSLEPHFAGSCEPVGGAVGAEDITIHPNGRVAYISSDDRRATLAGAPVPGAIFAYDLSGGAEPLVNLTPEADATFHPHGIALWVGPDGAERLFVVNHPGESLFGDNPGDGPAHTIELFDVVEGRLVAGRKLADDLLISPNDVFPVGPDRFYVTNDHGSSPGGLSRTLEDYLRLKNANVLYFDGESFRVVAEDLRYANGIAGSADGSRLYVSAVTSFEVTVYDRDEDSGALTRVGEIEVGMGPDNIELDAEGDLWVAGHPKLLTFVSYSKDAEARAPSQVSRITPGEDGQYEVTEIFLSEGDDLSGSSVAARFGDRLLIGSVFDPIFLDCTLDAE